jgi:hypothetical protein
MQSTVSIRFFFDPHQQNRERRYPLNKGGKKRKELRCALSRLHESLNFGSSSNVLKQREDLTNKHHSWRKPYQLREANKQQKGGKEEGGGNPYKHTQAPTRCRMSFTNRQ